MRYATSTYKTLSDDGDLQHPNPAMLETADVRRATLRSGSRNAGWPLQLQKNSFPLDAQSRQGRALWGRRPRRDPAVGSWVKESAACTRKAILTTHVHYSNKSRITARLQELMLCLLGCLWFRADLGLIIRSGPFCPSCPSWDRSPSCKTTNNLLPTMTVINHRS
jgi:hypothetical protein